MRTKVGNDGKRMWNAMVGRLYREETLDGRGIEGIF